jgi:hypothetical protein
LFYALAALTMVLGLLSHENGIFIPLALAGVEWLERPPTGLRNAWRRPFLPYFLGTVIYLLIWINIPKSSEQGLASPQTLLFNAFPYLQTIAYPLLPGVRLDAGHVWPLAGVALFAALATFATAIVARAVGLWLFAAGWFLCAALPSMLFLSSEYLYGSPRLHYLPALGVALMWSMPVLALARRWTGKQRWLLAVLQSAYILLIAIPPLRFVDCQMDFYAQTSAIVRQMSAAATAAPAKRPLLFVNTPFYFSSYGPDLKTCANPYPWTPVGGIVVPPYARLADFVRFNGGPDRPSEAATVSAYGPGWTTIGSDLAVE